MPHDHLLQVVAGSDYGEVYALSLAGSPEEECTAAPEEYAARHGPRHVREEQLSLRRTPVSLLQLVWHVVKRAAAGATVRGARAGASGDDSEHPGDTQRSACT